MLWFLLTSTVRPHPGVSVTVGDEGIRRAQYANALTSWVNRWRTDSSRIVLVENSGEDLQRLASHALSDCATDPVLISAPSPKWPGRGKGAAEASMIDYAVSKLDDLEDEDLLFKVTGRLYVRNAKRIVPTDVGGGQIILRGAFDWSFVDTRLVGASGDVWRSAFARMNEAVDEGQGILLEHVFAQRAMEAVWSRAAVVKRFSGRPIFVGLSGTSGSEYGGWRPSLRHAALAPLEVAMRRIPNAKQF